MSSTDTEALMQLAGKNILVLDLETANSADDCLHCGYAESIHIGNYLAHCGQFTKIGWDNKRALGISIGCYFSYRDMQLHWFDVHTLEQTVRHFVETQPLLVSFNGRAFDFVLMRALLRNIGEEYLATAERTGFDLPSTLRYAHEERMALCDVFKAHCATSYDILAEIWRIDPARKFERGLNSLDAIAQANGFGAKLMNGALAPQLWRQQRWAEVIEYCADDVQKTRRLFEQIVSGQPILRGDGLPITLPMPQQLQITKRGGDGRE